MNSSNCTQVSFMRFNADCSGLLVNVWSSLMIPIVLYFLCAVHFKNKTTEVIMKLHMKLTSKFS